MLTSCGVHVWWPRQERCRSAIRHGVSMRIWGVLAAGEIPKPPRRALVSKPVFLGTVERAAWLNPVNRGPELCVSKISPDVVGLGWGPRIYAARSGCKIRGINAYTSMYTGVHAGFCNATRLTLCCVICGLVSVFLTTFENFPLSSYKCSQSVGLL